MKKVVLFILLGVLFFSCENNPQKAKEICSESSEEICCESSELAFHLTKNAFEEKDVKTLTELTAFQFNYDK